MSEVEEESKLCTPTIRPTNVESKNIKKQNTTYVE
jgi:hypothetical protein